MTKGVLLIARNNSRVNYIKQAEFSAKRIKQYLNLPVSLITDNVEYANDIFDSIIIDNTASFTKKNYNNGDETHHLDFKNTTRSRAYKLSPYNETLLLDTDLIISNDRYLNCFSQAHDFLIYDRAFEFSNWRDLSEFDYISDTGPKFYWATAIFFRKSDTNKVFFDLIEFIQENWSHYKKLYQIKTPVFRNDHAFSIAIHMMNNNQPGNFAHSMPDTLYYSSDKDLLLSIKDDEFQLLVEKSTGQYFPVSIKGSTVHVMNKFSLESVINNA